jgi:hypothetical protein
LEVGSFSFTGVKLGSEISNTSVKISALMLELTDFGLELLDLGGEVSTAGLKVVHFESGFIEFSGESGNGFVKIGNLVGESTVDFF